MSADREPGIPETLGEAREKVAALEAQVRVWRHLAETGSILSRDLGVVGVDEGAKALGALVQRSTRHASQGAKAMREKCALAMIAGASPEDLRALPLPTPEEILRVAEGPREDGRCPRPDAPGPWWVFMRGAEARLCNVRRDLDNRMRAYTVGWSWLGEYVWTEDEGEIAGFVWVRCVAPKMRTP